MQHVTVLFAPRVDAALVELIDHVDMGSIPTVLDFLERLQARVVKTLSTFPEAGSAFQGTVRMFPMEGYVFLYEHHPAESEVHVLDMIAPRVGTGGNRTADPVPCCGLDLVDLGDLGAVAVEHLLQPAPHGSDLRT